MGIGPGGPLDRTRRAEEAIRQSTVVVGYAPYLDLIADLLDGKERIASGMTREVERCRVALRRAAEGAHVVLISSGDPGVYGMAGLLLQLAEKERVAVPVDIVPGVSAAHATAARLGAPLMCDAAFISLSDLLVPWEAIRARLEAVAAVDLAVALYNPRSRTRVHQLDEARQIFCRHRPATTPVGIGTAVGTPHERIVISDLEHFCDEEIGMRTTVIVGASTTQRSGGWLITPRGYRV